MSSLVNNNLHNLFCKKKLLNLVFKKGLNKCQDWRQRGRNNAVETGRTCSAEAAQGNFSIETKTFGRKVQYKLEKL